MSILDSAVLEYVVRLYCSATHLMLAPAPRRGILKLACGCPLYCTTERASLRPLWTLLDRNKHSSEQFPSGHEPEPREVSALWRPKNDTRTDWEGQQIFPKCDSSRETRKPQNAKEVLHISLIVEDLEGPVRSSNAKKEESVLMADSKKQRGRSHLDL